MENKTPLFEKPEMAQAWASGQWIQKFEEFTFKYLEYLFWTPSDAEPTLPRSDPSNERKAVDDLLEEITRIEGDLDEGHITSLLPLMANLTFLRRQDFQLVNTAELKNMVNAFRITAQSYAYRILDMDIQLDKVVEFVNNVRQFAEFLLKSAVPPPPPCPTCVIPPCVIPPVPEPVVSVKRDSKLDQELSINQARSNQNDFYYGGGNYNGPNNGGWNNRNPNFGANYPGFNNPNSNCGPNNGFWNNSNNTQANGGGWNNQNSYNDNTGGNNWNPNNSSNTNGGNWNPTSCGPNNGSWNNPNSYNDGSSGSYNNQNRYNDAINRGGNNWNPNSGANNGCNWNPNNGANNDDWNNYDILQLLQKCLPGGNNRKVSRKTYKCKQIEQACCCPPRPVQGNNCSDPCAEKPRCGGACSTTARCRPPWDISTSMNRCPPPPEPECPPPPPKMKCPEPQCLPTCISQKRPPRLYTCPLPCPKQPECPPPPPPRMKCPEPQCPPKCIHQQRPTNTCPPPCPKQPECPPKCVSQPPCNRHPQTQCQNPCVSQPPCNRHPQTQCQNPCPPRNKQPLTCNTWEDECEPPRPKRCPKKKKKQCNANPNMTVQDIMMTLRITPENLEELASFPNLAPEMRYLITEMLRAVGRGGWNSDSGGGTRQGPGAWGGSERTPQQFDGCGTGSMNQGIQQQMQQQPLPNYGLPPSLDIEAQRMKNADLQNPREASNAQMGSEFSDKL